MIYNLRLWLTLALLPYCIKGSVLFTRQKGLYPSFYDDGNEPGDDGIDIEDNYAVDGMDIDVSGRNFNVLGTAITDCRCFDAGWCECGTAAITSTAAALTEAVASTGVPTVASNIIIAPYVYPLDNAINKYHISYKLVSSGHLLDRISEDVDLALHQYPGTWVPTNALIITWKVEVLAYSAMSDKFQVIISSKDDGTTYVMLKYGSITGITGAGVIRGSIASSASFARICPKLVPPSTTAANTPALDADLLTDTNRNCANKGTFVFLTTAASTCTDAATSCTVDNTDYNCRTAVVAQDTCTEDFVCSLDASGTTVTFDFYAKWYKFARIQALTYTTFIGSGTEAAPEMVTSLETGATCGADLPNPASSGATAADKFSVTITLATPECGFGVDTGAKTITFALLNYEGTGAGDAADVNFPFDYAGKAFFWGTCYYEEFGPVTVIKEFNNVSPASVMPPRTGRDFTFSVVDIDDKTTATVKPAVSMGESYFLQICYTPGVEFKPYADPFGIWGTTCAVSNVMTFPATNLATHERSEEFITAGCPVADNILELKQAFEGDAGNTDTATTPPDGSEWCINAGPFIAKRWNLHDGGGLVRKLFFECVINFCAVPAVETLCSDSCTTDPIARRRRSTSNDTSTPAETVFTSVDVIDNDTTEEEKHCVDTTVAISTIAALNVMLVIGVSMVTIVFMKIRAARRRNQKAGSVYSRGSQLSMHSRGTRSSHRSNRY